MKKTLHVNIGGTAFILDEDAYVTLREYLSEIEVRLEADEDREVMEDIETRIADIFQENLSTRVQVVTLEMVQRAKAIIGPAREFGEPRRGGNAAAGACGPGTGASRPPRRFVRSTNDRIIGGVCGGIAAYFNLDPLLIRLITVALAAISVGTLAFVYVVLWMVMPAAETPPVSKS